MPKRGRHRKRTRQPGRRAKDTTPSASLDRRAQRNNDRVSRSWRFHAVALTITCCLGAALYSNSLDGGFIFDDRFNIEANPFILKVTELDWRQLYDAATKSPSPRPVANVSFALNHWFGRLDVTSYHVVNIVIHLLSGILVYFLASLTYHLSFDTRYRDTASVGDRTIGWMALFAACIFVAHPLQTQAVSYIVQRMTSMATMFYLLALLLYIHGRLSHHSGRRWALWAGGLISWLAAMGSKEIAVTLPLLIALYEWYFFQDLSRQWLRSSMKYFLAVGVVFVLVMVVFLGTSPLEKILSGYERRDFTMGQRVLTQFRVLIHYISLMLLPSPSRLNLLHHIPTSRSLLEPITTLFSMATVTGLVGAAVYYARRQRLISFCVLWFFLNLAIESSVVGLEMIYEHRLYLPMFAFSLAVPYGVYSLRSKQAAAPALIAVLVILGLGTSTYVRNWAWRDAVVFWHDVISKNPQSPRAYNSLGLVLQRRGQITEAIEHYHRALQIDSDYAPAHHNLGRTFLEQGKIAAAAEHSQQAVHLDPNLPEAQMGLGQALESQGNLEEAIEHLRQAVQIRPHYAQAHYNLGNILAGQERMAEAAEHYRQAVQIKPEYSLAYNNLGVVLQRQGRLAEAVEQYHQSLRIDPDQSGVHNNLSLALYDLADVHAEAGRFGEAISTASKAIEAAMAAGNEGSTRKIRARIASYRESASERKPDR